MLNVLCIMFLNSFCRNDNIAFVVFCKFNFVCRMLYCNVSNISRDKSYTGLNSVNWEVTSNAFYTVSKKSLSFLFW
jgi:hypothetical protein